MKFEIRSSLFHKIFLFIFIERLIRRDICRWIRKREKTNALCSVLDTIAMECTWNVIQYTARRWARRNRSARSVIDSELLHTTFVRAPIQSSYDVKLYIGVIQRGERSIGNRRIVTFSLFNYKIEASTARCLGNCFNLVSEARWLASKWSRESIQRYVLTFVLITNEQLCYFYTNASTRGKRKFVPIGFMIFTLNGALRLSS